MWELSSPGQRTKAAEIASKHLFLCPKHLSLISISLSFAGELQANLSCFISSRSGEKLPSAFLSHRSRNTNP